METILNILNKKYTSALKNIFYISSISKKIKLFTFLFIPAFILKKLRDNFS